MSTQELHVIFGTGPLGQWTARTLLELGHQVRLVNRSGTSADAPQGVVVVKGDATDERAVRALTSGAAAVYQCAQPAYHRWVQEFPAFQAAIVAGTAASGAKLIVAENLYVYGEPYGQPLTEQTPYAAHTKKGRVRQQMTETLFAAHRAGTLRVASARGSDFFGPFDRVSAEQVYGPALAGKTLNMIGRLDQPHSFTYVVDFGRTLATLGTRDAALGRAWHVPTAPPVTQAELVKLIGAEIGRPVQARGSGALILGALGLFNPMIAEVAEMVYEFNQPFVIDSSAATKTFGLTATPLAEAIRATVAWYRSAHP